MMMSNENVEADIKDNKVKEGFLTKRSRHLKEWKERWMVLTKTHLYSFVQKGIYKNPTEAIPLKNVQTLKSYYKNQYDRPYTFRIESQEVNFHIYAKNNEEKWAWMTAIEKMTEHLVHPQNKSDTYNLIRQTIKMSSAVRDSLIKKEERRQSVVSNVNITDNQMKKFRLTVEKNVFNIKLDELLENHHPTVRESQVFFQVSPKKQRPTVQEKKQIQTVQIQKIVQKTVEVPVEKIVQKKVEVAVQKIVEKKVQVPIQRIVEKQVQVPVEKIVYEQKFVYVPEIRQKIVEKIVYKESSSTSDGEDFINVIEDSLSLENENPKPAIDFVIWLLTSRLKQYYDSILNLCLKSPRRRFFAQKFLLLLNDEIDEEKINSYFKFILVLYENTSEYFYSADLKVLIDILLRELQFNRSEFNQCLIMLILKSLAEKNWWIHQNHRRNDIKVLVRELQANSWADNKILATELLAKI